MTGKLVGTIVVGAGLLSLAGCRSAGADTITPPPSGGKGLPVTVTISSATLADDCAPASPPAASAPGAAKPTAGASAKQASADALEGSSVVAGRRACRQTSVQLGLTSGDGEASPFSIVKTQLFDVATGKLIQDMTPRNPRVWSEGRYQAWDRTVKPKQKLQVGYDMNAPDWSKMGGSQLAAQGKTFRLVMTVRVGGKESKVETRVQSAELMMEPNVVT